MPYFIEHNAGNGYVETAGRAVAADPLCLTINPAKEGITMANNSLTSRDDITQDYLRQILSYNPDTGEFFRLKSRRADFVGKRAGGNSTRSRTIYIAGFAVMEHRLAFLWMLGRWPDGVVDHINGNPYDNRWVNLRECSQAENQQNRPALSSGTSKYVGVSWCSWRKKWKAYITKNKRRYCLGSFDDELAAAKKYQEAKRKLHTFCMEGRADA